MNRKLVLLAILVAALFLGACTEEEKPKLAITEQQATIDIQSNLALHIEGFAEAILFLDQAPITTDLVDAMPSMGGEDIAIDPVDPVDPTLPPPEPMPEEPVSLDMRPQAQDMVTALMENIFTDANIETSTSTSITFRMGPATMCRESFDSDPAAPTYDASCISMLEDMPVRLAVTSRAAGDLDIDLLVGADKIKPVTFELYRSGLAVEIDLAATKAAIAAYAAAAGEAVELPTVMRGKVRAELNRASAQDFTVEFAVTSAIAVEANIEGETVRVAVATANPALSVHVNAAAEQVEFALDVNAFDLTIPGALMGGASMSCSYDPVTGIEDCIEESTGLSHGIIDLHLAGASATALLNAASDTLSITNIGLGSDTTTVRLDGQQFLGIDINAAAGRRFDATMKSTANGLEIVVTPSFELAVALAFQNLADQIADLPTWTLNDTLTLTLDGAASPKVLLNDSGIAVVEGALHLSSSAGNVDVAAGMCLVDVVVEGATEPHPFEQLASGVCQ